jgi:prepilin-type processing-associated H-X9-DG protein
LRETKSWKSYNGKWNRAYAFADGHVENAVVDTNDFTDWEAKHQPPEDQSVR